MIPNLCEAVYDVIIIPVLSDRLNLDNMERKEQKLQKFEYLKIENSFVDERNSNFHNF